METTQGLTQKKCVPCEGFETPLNYAEAEVLMRQLHDWKLSDDGKSISRSVAFKDFAGAMAMADKCAPLSKMKAIIRTFMWHGASLRSRHGRMRSGDSRKTISSWRPKSTNLPIGRNRSLLSSISVI